MRTAGKAAIRRALMLAVSGVLVIVCAIILINLESPHRATNTQNDARAPSVEGAEAKVETGTAAPTAGASASATPATPDIVAPAPPIPPAATPPGASTIVTDSDLSYLGAKKLQVPVEGVNPNQLRDSYLDGRSEGRVHQALDIMAPQGTPVLAATDGTVMKLFQSEKGGIMIYQSDPTGTYVYYYGHLQRYADGIVEGKQVKRGEIIAYVGDTGNAGPGNFHLHFGISKMSAPGKWSGGEPINPYPLLVN